MKGWLVAEGRAALTGSSFIHEGERRTAPTHRADNDTLHEGPTSSRWSSASPGLDKKFPRGRARTLKLIAKHPHVAASQLAKNG